MVTDTFEDDGGVWINGGKPRRLHRQVGVASFRSLEGFLAVAEVRKLIEVVAVDHVHQVAYRVR